MKAESFNFDIGVKNYKKNRLIVDKIHLTNEIRYTIETTDKPDFSISLVSYVNNLDNRFTLPNILRDLSVNDLSNSFNFFINQNGNMLTDVEMKDDTLLKSGGNRTNVVICLDGTKINSDNTGSFSRLYNYSQLSTLEQVLETFYYESRNTVFENLDVSNRLTKITNVGFNISDYVEGLDI